jgi:hypothetical protein
MFCKKISFRDCVTRFLQISFRDFDFFGSGGLVDQKRLARCPGDDNPILIEDPSGCVPMAVRSSGSLLSCQRYHFGGIWSLEDVRQLNAFPLVGDILGGVLLAVCYHVQEAKTSTCSRFGFGELGNQFPIAEFIGIYTYIFFLLKKKFPKRKINYK